MMCPCFEAIQAATRTISPVMVVGSVPERPHLLSSICLESQTSLSQLLQFFLQGPPSSKVNLLPIILSHFSDQSPSPYVAVRPFEGKPLGCFQLFLGQCCTVGSLLFANSDMLTC